jgi:hypothetical protein
MTEITRPRPLDIVKTPAGQVGLVTECSCQLPGNHGNNPEAQLAWLREWSETADFYRSYSVRIFGANDAGEKSAWYDPDELTVIDSLPRVLAKGLEHAFSSGDQFTELHFGEMVRPSYSLGQKREGGLHR